MKFVWVPSINRFRRTEGEVKKAKQTYQVLEIETDKDSLIDRFNAYEERIEALQQQNTLGGHTAAKTPTDESAPEQEAVVTSPTPSAPVQPIRFSGTAVETWVLHEAKPYEIENLFSALGCRFHELRKRVRIDEGEATAPSPANGDLDRPQPVPAAAAAGSD